MLFPLVSLSMVAEIVIDTSFIKKLEEVVEIEIRVIMIRLSAKEFHLGLVEKGSMNSIIG